MVCPKHDVRLSGDGSCWCCEQEKKKAKKATKENAKKKPEDVSSGDSGKGN